MQGQVESVFSPEQFWDAVFPRVPRLTKIWDLYQNASQAESEEKAKGIARTAYQGFIDFIFELLKTPEANKNIDRVAFENYCHGTCTEIDRFY